MIDGHMFLHRCCLLRRTQFDVVTLDHYWTNVLQNRPVRVLLAA